MQKCKNCGLEIILDENGYCYNIECQYVRKEVERNLVMLQELEKYPDDFLGYLIRQELECWIDNLNIIEKEKTQRFSDIDMKLLDIFWCMKGTLDGEDIDAYTYDEPLDNEFDYLFEDVDNNE